MTIVHVQVPIGLDVIIIGGGVSGMAAAATLSKAGKKVLVLEQNEGLGGGTSTVFIKGVEFSIGAFFLGEVGERKSILRTALDQVTDGQVDFVPIGSLQDKVYIGRDVREYEIHGGNGWAPQLKRQFPDAHREVDRFMENIDAANAWRNQLLLIKMFPEWLVRVPIFSKLLSMLTQAFEVFRGQSLKDVVVGVTGDLHLREVLAFRYGWQYDLRVDS